MLGGAATARAADPPNGPVPAQADESPEVVQAREEFVEATELAHQSQWAEALASFERSARHRPHAVTAYNIAFCQRALGAYTVARDAFAKALQEDQAAGGVQLPEMLRADAKGYLAEIDALLASANVSLSPAEATVAVDGRPLESREGSSERVLVAGVRAPGPGEAAPGSSFRVLLNPGLHVFTFNRQGFEAAIDRRTLLAGLSIDLHYELDRLPATLHIASNQEGAIVTVGEADVGAAPVDVSRPAGSYEVVVKKRGFKPFEVQVVVQPGQDLDVRAPLSEDRPALTQRWWFWSAVGVVVAGAVVTTYALTQSTPAPVQPPLQQGGLWTVRLR